MTDNELRGLSEALCTWLGIEKKVLCSCCDKMIEADHYPEVWSSDETAMTVLVPAALRSCWSVTLCSYDGMYQVSALRVRDQKTGATAIGKTIQEALIVALLGASGTAEA